MGPVDIIAIVAIALVVGGALAYIIVAKKRGQKCIGCPHSKQCKSCCSGKCDISKSDKAENAE